MTAHKIFDDAMKLLGYTDIQVKSMIAQDLKQGLLRL